MTLLLIDVTQYPLPQFITYPSSVNITVDLSSLKKEFCCENLSLLQRYPFLIAGCFETENLCEIADHFSLYLIFACPKTEAQHNYKKRALSVK